MNDNEPLGTLGDDYPHTSSEGIASAKERVVIEATVLFAAKGYSNVTMKEIAEQVGITAPTLYYYFDSKEALWSAALDNIEHLYMLYFERLGATIQAEESFGACLDAMFVELKTVINIFTYYGFSLIQTEQFRDQRAGRIYQDVFLKYSINYIKERFDETIRKGLAPPFDTNTVATIIMHSVLTGINVRVHEHMGRGSAYDVTGMFADLQAFIAKTVLPGQGQAEAPD